MSGFSDSTIKGGTADCGKAHHTRGLRDGPAHVALAEREMAALHADAIANLADSLSVGEDEDGNLVLRRSGNRAQRQPRWGERGHADSAPEQPAEKKGMSWPARTALTLATVGAVTAGGCMAKQHFEQQADADGVKTTAPVQR